MLRPLILVADSGFSALEFLAALLHRGITCAEPELLAMVLEAKFGQHLPLNRQSKTYAREGTARGKHHEMPVHHTLQEYLDGYIEAAGIVGDRRGPLFRTAEGRTGRLNGQAMAQPDVYRMIQRRAEAAGVATNIGCHSWRARGITAYLENGGLLEHAQQMAGHASARTTNCPSWKC